MQKQRMMVVSVVLVMLLMGLATPVAIAWVMAESAAGATEAASNGSSVSLTLVLDQANRRVMAFDGQTGDLLTPNFMVSYTGSTYIRRPYETTWQADSAHLLVTNNDYIGIDRYNVAQEMYSLFGDLSATAGNGIVQMANGDVLVGGWGVVQRFTSEGAFLGNLITVPIAATARDVLVRNSDILVSWDPTYGLQRYSLTGSPLGAFGNGV